METKQDKIVDCNVCVGEFGGKDVWGATDIQKTMERNIKLKKRENNPFYRRIDKIRTFFYRFRLSIQFFKSLKHTEYITIYGDRSGKIISTKPNKK